MRLAPRRGAASLAALLAWLAALVLGGCASRPTAPAGSDGPPLRPPAALEQVPDAQPRIEPLRTGGPNKPYEVFGQRYVPMTADLPWAERGGASWYGRKFHGLPTSSGEPYDMYAMTAAHKTMPIPSYARVRNPANGREVTVRINDRGPFAAGRVIDLSYTAALKLGLLRGVAPVEVRRLTHDEIRAGLATRPAPSPLSSPLPGQGPGPALPPDDPAPGERPQAEAGFWLQLGAFRLREGALQMQQRVLRETEGLPGVAVFEEAGLLRVQAGPFATREQALAAAELLQRQAGLAPLVVQRAAPLSPAPGRPKPGESPLGAGAQRLGSP
ncbi:MAG: septal ring lytic transglycosylase RlpA family protein [Rubrivivax sp.]|nr:septal ring lytic transglycosylase RlpA family protein [Rubrivivax sp.]